MPDLWVLGAFHPDVHKFVDLTLDTENKRKSDSGKEEFASSYDKIRLEPTAVRIQRLADRQRSSIDTLLDHHAQAGQPSVQLDPSWTTDRISAPNVTDKETIISLARMAATAYAPDSSSPEWQNVTGSGYNYTDSFGWEMDGLRGHIFTDESNSTLVLAIKGTSMAIFDGTETEPTDKTNDNLFASCCCGEGQYRWKRVCNCKTEALTCNATCVKESLREKDHYYNAARDLYHNVTHRYPYAEVWLVGHSLGGVVSSLLGLTYGLPVVTFEAYPDALAASRLGLPTPPGYKIGSASFPPPSINIHHFGHTADPVFMGTCNTWSSSCSIAGYAMEGTCHTGEICQYDTVGDLGWHSSVRTHSIVSVIMDVLEKYESVPSCEADVDCVDCFKWKYFESNGSSPTTSSVSLTSTSSSSYTRTRTETCQTPGWWGCRDSTTSLFTTSQSTSSATPCHTPGWFGCKDSMTTVTSTTSTSTAREPSNTSDIAFGK